MIALRTAVMMIAIVMASGCDETVTGHYSTRADAESQMLFASGWLPDIVPDSSRDITIRNDLDLNLSEGEFFFDPEHSLVFLGHLRRMEESEASGSEGVSLIERGYWPYHYSDEDSSWVFFVNSSKGHCEYRMGLTRLSLKGLSR